MSRKISRNVRRALSGQHSFNGLSGESVNEGYYIGAYPNVVDEGYALGDFSDIPVLPFGAVAVALFFVWFANR